MRFHRFSEGLYFPFQRLYVSLDNHFICWVLERHDKENELYVEFYDGVRAWASYVKILTISDVETFEFSLMKFSAAKNRICCYDEIDKFLH